MPEFTYSEDIVIVESTGLPAINTTGVFRSAGGGAALPVWDLNGSLLPNIRVSELGVHEPFMADADHGVLDFGSTIKVKESVEFRNAGSQALALVKDLQAAVASLQAGTTNGFARVKALPREPVVTDGNDGDVFLYHPNFTG